MNTNNLLPVSNLEENEIYAGWYTSSSDGWDGGYLPEVDVYPPGGGGGMGGYLPPVDVYPPGGGGSGGGSMPGGGREDDTQIGGGGSSSTSETHNLSGELKVCEQKGETAECTFVALGAINKYLGGEALGIHKDDFAEHLGIASNLLEGATNIMLGNGLEQPVLNGLINDFYVNETITNTNQIAGQLDNGHPIIATLVISREGNDINGHAVVITGFNPDTGMVTIADSLASGQVQSFAFDPEKLINLTAISGIKDNDITNKYKNDSGDWWKGCQLGK